MKPKQLILLDLSVEGNAFIGKWSVGANLFARIHSPMTDLKTPATAKKALIESDGKAFPTTASSRGFRVVEAECLV